MQHKTAYIYKIGQKFTDGKPEVHLIELDVVKVIPTPSSPKTQVFKDVSATTGETIWTVMMYYEDMNEEYQKVLNSIMAPAALALEQFVIENASRSDFTIPSTIVDK
jgi:hypothetical protein